MTRELMVVDLFYNLEQLNDQKTLAEAGISAGAEVQILFGTMAPVECPNRKSAGVEELVVVKIPDSAGAFNNCQSLVQFTIPNSVTSIGCGAFSCCHSLAEMIIPNSVAHIGDLAFENCSSLEQVTIPESITCIGEDVFAGTRISTSQEAEVNQASCGKKSGAQGKKTCS
ncbi:unnamed protein product [Durusdinium trenchii]|uniref:Leucine-rich repeat domain-containing protein n=2 Tax=Durusdinium trenchii TaxID=1381693 RepID=A0ABP0SAG7_9DINO